MRARGGSRAVTTSKMEHFAIIVHGFLPSTIITKRSNLDVVVALNSPLGEVIITQISYGFDQENWSFWGEVLVQVQ